jgi:hypothetical protein
MGFLGVASSVCHSHNLIHSHNLVRWWWLQRPPGGEMAGNEWWRPLGLHASAHAANAGLVNRSEAPLVFASRFNDSATICSFSNFNQCVT